jgi:acyl-CoA synthetase (AMP-forming)/AMP-acid ligase II
LLAVKVRLTVTSDRCARTCLVLAEITQSTRVTIIAGNGIGHMIAAPHRSAGIIRAGIIVLTLDRFAEASSLLAVIRDTARVLIVT